MKPYVWTFSNLRDAENCLRQFHHRHILKDTPFVETEAMKWGTLVHEAMEVRLRTGFILPESMAAYEQFVPQKSGRLRGLVELKMGMKEDGTACDFFADDVWGRGKLDFGLVDHEAKSACIVDWKTGNIREDPDELEIFALLLKAKYPHLEKITGWYVWLKEMRMGKVHDLGDTNGKLAHVKLRVQRIREAIAMDSFPPKQGPLCGWCAIKQCEFHS